MKPRRRRDDIAAPERRRFVRAASAAAVAAVAGAAAPAAKAQGAQALRGVWRIVTYTRDGEKVDLDAIMIITGRHYTRVQSERTRKPFEFDFRKLDALNPAQVRQIADAYVGSNASAGTCRVEKDVFYFSSIAHHNPGAVGGESKRRFTLKGNRLQFFGPAGSGDLDELWERVETL
jgi:hypothetical protein